MPRQPFEEKKPALTETGQSIQLKTLNRGSDPILCEKRYWLYFMIVCDDSLLALKDNFN